MSGDVAELGQPRAATARALPHPPGRPAAPPGVQASLPGPSALATFLADLFFQAKLATDEGFSWTVMQHYLSEDPSLP